VYVREASVQQSMQNVAHLRCPTCIPPQLLDIALGRGGGMGTPNHNNSGKTLALVADCGLWSLVFMFIFLAQQLHYGPKLGLIKHHLMHVF
jgi:hypothetical protein